MGTNLAPSAGTKTQLYEAAWTDLAEIVDISGPDFSKDEIEVPSLDAVGGFKRYISGLKDAGTITLELNFTKKTFKKFFDIFKLDGPAGIKWFSFIFNDAVQADDKSTFWFQASVTQIPLRASSGDRVTATATLRLTGEPKFGLAGGNARSIGQGTDAVAFAEGEIRPADPTA